MKSIKLNDVTKSFKQAGVVVEALKHTNFTTELGEFIAIIGPSGSGKSTLLTIAGGLQSPSSGNVMIGEKDFGSQSEKERSGIRFEEIGFVLQASNLIPFLTVIDQLKLHDKVKGDKFQEKRAFEILESLEILHIKDKYPSELSGGERQRVAIARAIYHSPSLVLADEPTASLDTNKAVAVVILLSRLSKDMKTTIIMVTHDERMIEYCDSVYVMRDGVLSKNEDHKKTK